MGPDAELCHREISKFSVQRCRGVPASTTRCWNASPRRWSRCSAKRRPIRCRCRPSGGTSASASGSATARNCGACTRRSANLVPTCPQAVEIAHRRRAADSRTLVRSDVLKATLATDAIIGAFLSISSPGSAYVLLHHVMGEAGGARGVWGYVHGGMGRLSDAISRRVRRPGRRDSPRSARAVRFIPSAAGDRRGARRRHADSRRRVVASSVDAISRSRNSSTRRSCPNISHAVARIDYASASAKINLALAEPPNFHLPAVERRGAAPSRHDAHRPVARLLGAGYDDAKYGRPSERSDSRNDDADERRSTPSRRPASTSSRCSCSTRRTNWRDAHWDDIKEAFADRCIAALAEYAPNVPGAIEHRQVLSPLDLERVFGITGGNIMQGAMNAHQLFCFRPVAGWADHRTPVDGPVPVRRRQPPRRRRDGSLRQERGGGDF